MEIQNILNKSNPFHSGTRFACGGGLERVRPASNKLNAHHQRLVSRGLDESTWFRE